MIPYDSLKDLMVYKNSAPHATRIMCELNYAASLSNALQDKQHCKVVCVLIV